jgi:hypothetical protein
MNRQLETRMKKLEEKSPVGPSAIIVYAKWDELNENAIAASFVRPPPTDVPIFVFTEQMTTDEWLALCPEGPGRPDLERDARWLMLRVPPHAFG